MKSFQSESASTPKKAHVSSPSVFTPERLPPTRIRNQNFALSVSDIRKSALNLLKSRSDQAPSKSTRNESLDQKPKRSNKSPTLLPEKSEILCEFFDAMVSSFRLFRLKRLTATFSKLCRHIESLTDRRFTLRHLAQLKHIMPDVIVVQKTRVQDEETSCMKEDLMIKLEVDSLVAANIVKGPAMFSQLKGLFKSRITDYSTTHHEDDNIPEDELPQLFCRGKQDPKPCTNEMPISVAASLISPSFKSRFSSRFSSASISESSPAKPSFCLIETPIKAATSKVEDGSSSLAFKIQSTPVARACTPAKLMAATSALCSLKRTLISPDDHIDESNNRAKRCRSLTYDDSEVDIEDQASKLDGDEDKSPVMSSIANKDVFDILPKDLLQSVRDNERRFLHEQDPVVSLARRRQKLVASVPKLFDMICILFRSIRRSIITKEELIHKLISGNLDIVDRKEVEEQLMLLQEIAPEYISEQLSLSGDILVRLNKSSDPASIRAKLVDSM